LFWNVLNPFLLFVLRQVPHTTTAPVALHCERHMFRSSQAGHGAVCMSHPWRFGSRGG
jgi:hypothetical protein